VHVDRTNLESDLAQLARTNDALPAWEQELAQHHLSHAAAKTCKAVLVGDAADETHYGYHFLLDDAATQRPRAVIERFTAPILRRELGDPVGDLDRRYRALSELAGHSWETPDDRVRATTWLVVNRWLPRLLHNGDIHAMAHGLEARVPFADLELLALASRISPRAGGAKAALRTALRGRLPEDIRTRTKSALPKDQAVAARYQREARKLLAEDATDLGRLIDHEQMRALCADGRELDERERALLFRVICLVHWQRTYEVALG
jgi:asparagine synthase (glutamine-hydrolysing)